MVQETEKKHSPLPWRLLESKVPGYERYISVVHGEETNLSICQLSGAGSLNPKVLEEVRANADLIIRAVNSHDALIEALEAIAPRCGFIVDRDRGTPCGVVAVAQGSFGLNYCRAHKGDRETVDAGVKVETALAAAKE
jgi:hypothetical protein